MKRIVRHTHTHTYTVTSSFFNTPLTAIKVKDGIAEDAANYSSEIERLGGGLCLSVSPDYTLGADSDAAARAKTRSGGI